MALKSGETEPMTLGEMEPASLGSGETEPAPLGSGETEPRGLEVGQDLLIHLEPFGGVNVGANFLALGIANIDSRQTRSELSFQHLLCLCTVTGR